MWFACANPSGDGVEGYAAGAPYDLIVASVGLCEIRWRWVWQLAPSGSIVAPLHLRGGVHDHVLVRLVRDGSGLVGRGVAPLSIVVVREPSAAPHDEGVARARPQWRGAALDRLHVRKLPKDERLVPGPTPKVIEKRESYVVLEASNE